MNKAKLLYTILSTLNDVRDEGYPSGHLYAALMSFGVDHEQYSSMIAELTHAEFITQSNYVLRIAEKGVVFVQMFDNLLAKAKAEKAL